ncbi:hypothetical protein ACH5RR_021702 [Cinchona calisaya]|uniref:Uncharacterized protein n=1 Tax=Cinchona calisaya TaxID=153742 RepID=A0ABD2ZJC1_9GENT
MQRVKAIANQNLQLLVCRDDTKFWLLNWTVTGILWDDMDEIVQPVITICEVYSNSNRWELDALQQQLSMLRIEEDNKVSKRKASPSSFVAKVNMVEQVQKSQKKNLKKKLAMKGKGIAKS